MELSRLEEQRQELLSQIHDWPEACLVFRPSAAEWSAVEVFDHLQKTEFAILEAAKVGVAKPHGIGVRDRLGYLFVKKVFETDRKVKVPGSAKMVLPAINPQMADVLAAWQTTRDALRTFYAGLTPQQRGQGIFRHPVTGWMDMSRILGFFSVHMRHHAFQLALLRSASEGCAGASVTTRLSR